MKLKQNSIHPQTFESPHQQAMLTSNYLAYSMMLQRPNPPTAEDVARAKFVDKTYVWKPSK